MQQKEFSEVQVTTMDWGKKARGKKATMQISKTLVLSWKAVGGDFTHKI